MSSSVISTTQLDIFGKRPNTKEQNSTNSISNSVSTKKFYPMVSLLSGLNELELQNDFMLIHRILQRRLKTDINRNIMTLIQVVYNEMLIKSGRMDISTATRNSLLVCLV